MAQKESGREVLSAGAGLAAEVALESGAQLGEIQAVRARGYWEQVWIRFRKDKVAIASGFVIVLLILGAFPGAPLAEKWLATRSSSLGRQGSGDVVCSPVR